MQKYKLGYFIMDKNAEYRSQDLIHGMLSNSLLLWLHQIIKINLQLEHTFPFFSTIIKYFGQCLKELLILSSKYFIPLSAHIFLVYWFPTLTAYYNEQLNQKKIVVWI